MTSYNLITSSDIGDIYIYNFISSNSPKSWIWKAPTLLEITTGQLVPRDPCHSAGRPAGSWISAQKKWPAVHHDSDLGAVRVWLVEICWNPYLNAFDIFLKCACCKSLSLLSHTHCLFGTYVLLARQQHDNTENLTGQSQKRNEIWVTHADTVTGLSIVCAFCEILVQTSVGDAAKGSVVGSWSWILGAI